MFVCVSVLKCAHFCTVSYTVAALTLRYIHLTRQHLISGHRLSSTFCPQLVSPLPHTPATHKTLHLMGHN